MGSISASARWPTPVVEVIKSAVARARRAFPKPEHGSERRTQKDVVLDRLAEGAALASSDGKYRYTQRQLFYAVRPFVMRELGVELQWDNFKGIITDYENEHGDVGGMYRDPRGTLYHPHIGESISLGTLAVEQYRRPEWTFG